jgi:hypothetical protein
MLLSFLLAKLVKGDEVNYGIDFTKVINDLTNNTETITGALTITSPSANALSVGLAGSAGAAFNVDASTPSQAAGLNVKGAATGGTVAVAAIDTGSNTSVTLDGKGTGTLGLNTVSTTSGLVTIGNSTSGAGLTINGVTTIQNSTTPLVITQAIATTGSPTGLLFTGAAHTTLTASVEATDINFNLARTVQFATGALTTQRAMRIQAPTYAAVAASTITTATTLEISGAPAAGTNVTITNPRALVVAGGTAEFKGNVFLNSTNNLNLADGNNIIIGSGTGTKIGIATTNKLGFFNATPVVQQTQGATLTNNVTSGGTANQLDNFTSLTVYATDAGAIRDDIYQLGQTTKAIVDGLRALGLFS